MHGKQSTANRYCSLPIHLQEYYILLMISTILLVRCLEDLHLHERPVHLAGHPIGWTASTQVLHFDIPCLIKTMSLHQDCVAR